MPKTYDSAARKVAFEIYLSGASLEFVARRMRVDHGFATYSVETLRRWVEEGGWKETRDKRRSQEADNALDVSLDDLEESMLQDLMTWANKTKDQLEDTNQKANFAENMGLLIRIFGLIDKALVRRSGSSVDKPRLWLEFFTDMMEDLRKKDLQLFNRLAEHMDYFKACFKERHKREAV